MQFVVTPFSDSLCQGLAGKVIEMVSWLVKRGVRIEGKIEQVADVHRVNGCSKNDRRDVHCIRRLAPFLHVRLPTTK